jgi:hypothetical protein
VTVIVAFRAFQGTAKFKLPLTRQNELTNDDRFATCDLPLALFYIFQ